MPTIQEARPPFVRFEIRAVEDREASIKQGFHVARDVAFAVITPAGSKDCTEKIAEEWLANMRDQVQQERLPAEWYQHYRRLYDAWKEGREAPETGLSVRNWPVASPAQIELLLSLRIRTVEDLAVANEEAISRMGMGGRALKQKAVDWLASASTHGRAAEQAADLRAELARVTLALEQLKEENQLLKERILQMAAQGETSIGDAADDGPDDIQLNVVLPKSGSRKL